jgi:hypothetical protein
MKRMTQTLRKWALPLAISLSLSALGARKCAAQDEFLAGYLIIPTADKVERSYNAGYSMYIRPYRE